MKRPYLVFRGLLVVLLCSRAFAAQQVLVTIDPNNFAPGQNISNVNAGAQLQAMTAVLNPDPNAPPSQFYLPKFLPVYAQPVTADCNFFGATCSVNGNLTFGFTRTTQPSSIPILWGETFPAALCLTGDCDGEVGQFLAFIPSLLITLTTPTDHVDALIAFAETEGSSILALALDGAGQVVGMCDGFPDGTRGTTNNPCASLFKFTAPPDAGWGRYSVISSAGDIKYVLVGGLGSDRAVSQVRFNSPVSLQLAGLLGNVEGAGPGTSLADKVKLAQAYYAVPDIRSTCAMLGGFVDEVKAQSGKHLETLMASQLVTTATAIEAAIGCN
jgi:hypothetical protein